MTSNPIAAARRMVKLSAAGLRSWCLTGGMNENERVVLPESARELIESGSLAHVVTLNADGSPQVSCIWVGLENEEIVSGHLRLDQQKLRNIARDPRVALSIEGTQVQPLG